MNRQQRLMPCLAAVPKTWRPISANEARATSQAAPTNSASVLLWLGNKPTTTLHTHADASLRLMAGPFPFAIQDYWRNPFTAKRLKWNRHLSFHHSATGDDSGRCPLAFADALTKLELPA